MDTARDQMDTARELAADLATGDPLRRRLASPVRLSLISGDPILVELDPELDVHRCDLVPRPVARRPWWRDAAVLWRPFVAARQLLPSVWVADDLDILVVSAAEAMTMRDPCELPGSDGWVRRFVRCSSDVWRALRASRSLSPRLERLRETLAAVHGLPIPRLNTQAAA